MPSALIFSSDNDKPPTNDTSRHTDSPDDHPDSKPAALPTKVSTNGSPTSTPPSLKSIPASLGSQNRSKRSSSSRPPTSNGPYPSFKEMDPALVSFFQKLSVENQCLK